VSRAPAHDPPSSDPLYYLDALHRLALRLTRRPSEAEDLVQETYLRAFRGAGHFVPGTDLRAWLFRVLRNAFLDARRREARSPIDAEADAEVADLHREDCLRGDAELERLRGVVGEEIEEALRALPEEARTVILLDLEGLTESEIGEVMACPRGTVKSRLHRARSALRARLAAYRR
jgi:RNA polymerase sigma-70 factor (ECF subfamily)